LAQSDIYDLLKNKRLSGDRSYFSARQIDKMLRDKNIELNIASINNNLLGLRVFGFLDTRIEASSKKRIKKVYVTYRLKLEALST